MCSAHRTEYLLPIIYYRNLLPIVLQRPAAAAVIIVEINDRLLPLSPFAATRNDTAAVPLSQLS